MRDPMPSGMTAPIIGAPRVEVNEAFCRGAVEQVRKIVSQTGQLPISDPASVLLLALVLDKLDALNARLDALTKINYGPGGPNA